VLGKEEAPSSPTREVTALPDSKELADSLREKVVIRATDPPSPSLSRPKTNFGVWGWVVALVLFAVLLLVVLLRRHQPTPPQPPPAPSPSWAPTPGVQPSVSPYPYANTTAPTAEKTPTPVSEATPIANNAEAEKAVRTATKEQPFVNSLGMKFVPVAPTQVLFSVWDTRVEDYDAFVTGTKRIWIDPSFGRRPTHPAVNVSWDDATAFCLWLTEKERKEGRLPNTKEYRLASDIEWSQAVGLDHEDGSTPKEKDAKIKQVYPWGTQWPPPKNAGNYATALRVDFYEFTSPVGSFRPNKFGLYDMGGNVWQWCEDWFDDSQRGRVLRGASHGGVDPVSLLSSFRAYSGPERGSEFFGFRCVIASSAQIEQLPQPPFPASAFPGERFPQTRSVIMTTAEVQTWNAEEIQYAINEMYARHGADFLDPAAKRNFTGFAWYNPHSGRTYEETEKLFSAIEMTNLKLLGFYRDARKLGVAAIQRSGNLSPSNSSAAQSPQETKLVYAPWPVYPRQGDKGRMTGSGRFRIRFDELGNARSVNVVESTGDGLLDRNTINTLKRWRAAPGSPSAVVVPITYK
jgi:TonB family protein